MVIQKIKYDERTLLIEVRQSNKLNDVKSNQNDVNIFN